MIDPYEVGNGYVPRPKIKRQFSPEAVLGSAAEAGGLLSQARRARRAPDEFVQYQVDPSPYDAVAPARPLPPEAARTLMERAGSQQQRTAPDEYVNYMPQSAGNSPFVPTRRQQQASPYDPETRPPMEMTVPSPAAPSFMESTDWHGSAASDEARRQAEQAAKPGANAIFKPRPEVGGRPENIADNVARETIARAAIAQATGDPNAEALMDQAATLAWRREAAVNGNARGDVAAPQDYIESWKGQVRAGGEGSPFADMFNRASQAARAAVEQERSKREGQMIRSTAPATVGTASSTIRSLTQPPAPRYGTARGGESSDAQYGTQRLPASQADDGFVSQVMSSVRHTPSAPLPPIAGGNRDDFIRTAAPYAQRVEAQTGIPAKLILAVAANETGWGNPKYVMGNNYHGIQAQAGEAGEGYTDHRSDGTPYQARMKSFATPEEGFRGFADFLTQNPRYKNALDKYRQTGDVNQLAADIHAEGYAEDPQYTTKIQSILEGLPDFPRAESPVTAPSGVETRRMAAPIEEGASLVDRVMAATRHQRQSPRAGGGVTAISAPVQAAQAGVTEREQTRAARSGQTVWEIGNLTPNQYSAAASEGLDAETADAVCGPAAAIAFARKLGRNPTMTEAVNLAKQVGWTAAAGMAGPASQLRLLQSMGIPASLEDGPPDEAKMIASIQAGNPVTVSTPGHYFVAEGYDPATGKFNFGESARVLKASGGNPWYTLEEIGTLKMGSPRGALYMGAQ